MRNLVAACLHVIVIAACAAVATLASSGSGGAAPTGVQAIKLIAGWPRQSYVIELEPFDTLGGARQLEAVRVIWASKYDAVATVSGGFSAGAILELDASIIQIPGGEYTPLTFSRRRAEEWLVGGGAGHGPVSEILIAEIAGEQARWTGPGVVTRYAGQNAPALLYARCSAFGAAFGADGHVEYASTPVPAMLSVEYEWTIVGSDAVTVPERAVVRRVRHVGSATDEPSPASVGETFCVQDGD